jgi:hypothetical protein
VASPERRLHNAEARPRGLVILNAGRVHSISRGARFGIFDSTDVDAPPLGELVADLVYGYTSVLRPIPPAQELGFQIPKPAYALQMSAGNGNPDVSILVSAEDKALCSGVVEALKKERADLRIRLVNDAEAPRDLVILRQNNQHFFEIDDRICNMHEFRRIPFSFPVDPSGSDLLSVFAGAGDFFRFLHQSNSDKKSDISAKVAIEAYLLEEDSLSSIDNPIPLPVGDNLNNGEEMAAEAALWEDDDDDSKFYGFNIASTSDKPLYVWIFTFEMNSLRIGECAPSTSLLWRMTYIAQKHSIVLQRLKTVPRPTHRFFHMAN